MNGDDESPTAEDRQLPGVQLARVAEPHGTVKDDEDVIVELVDAGALLPVKTVLEGGLIQQNDLLEGPQIGFCRLVEVNPERGLLIGPRSG